MAQLAYQALVKDNQSVEFIDLRKYNLPLCGPDEGYGHPDVLKLKAQITDSDGIVLAHPIYNFDSNSAVKNMIELTGRSAWTGKIVGFIAAAGGAMSYMSPMSLANSLMLDFRCVAIPRFVYATGHAFNDKNDIIDADLKTRIQGLSNDLTHFTAALKGITEKAKS